MRANLGDGQAFGDVVSGPHAITFSSDGGLAFVADTNSEDVLVVDTATRIEAQIIRPLPGHLPEGIVWADGELYVQERNSADVAAFKIGKGDSGITVSPDGRADSRRSLSIRCRPPFASGRSSSSRPTATTCR